ncbi:hypothetical protein RRG08_012851 [Elysia crispata]|uniref:K Homology domain-containing protein n=1 Tax=Elysia crispata TaxID=231223 RepID=A0AAE1EAZ9_9GAST|nr:hypothetical protein RRG08_012851 [Elysia crispata]
MILSPPKGANLPYRPKPLLSPLYIPGSQGFTVPASVASLPGQELSKGFPAQPVPLAHAIPMLPSAQNIVPGSLVPINGLGPAALTPMGPPIGPALGPPLWPAPLPPPPPHHQQQPQPPHCLSLGPSLQYTPRAGAPPGPPHQQALPAPPGPQAQEMNIPNDLIGCIIGRGGQKINEIRQVSGATIKISNAEDGSSDRKVTITGPPECIGLAQYLISTSMELHKTLTLDPASLTPVSCVGGALPPMPPHPMAMTVVKPLPPHHPGVMNFGGINGLSGLNGVAAAGVNMGAAINGINGLAGMPGLPPFLADPGALTPSPPGVAPPSAATSMAIAVPSSSPLSPGGAKQLQTKMRVGLTATTAFKAAERPKFAPY